MSEPGFRYYLITDRKQSTRRPLIKSVEEACRMGVKAVQLREKDLSGRKLYELAGKLKAVTSRWKAKLFINDRADVAMAIGADGVHCPEDGLSPGEIHKLDSKLLVGVSVHSIETAKLKEKEGADFLLFGPVYHTPSKVKYGDPQGMEKLKEVVETVQVPVFAVGGITPKRAKTCLTSGAYGVAGITSILQAASIEQKVQEWNQALGKL